MKKISMLFLLLMLNGILLKCQNKFEIEASEGFVFFDYFGNEPEGWDKVYAGYGLQTELDILKNIFISNTINLKLGIGYTKYNYLYFYGISFIAREEISTSYLNLKFGFDYKPKWRSLYFLMRTTNYFLLHNEKQQNSQNRWFSNLDLGLKIKVINNLHISAWFPITLYPMHKGKFVSRPIDFDYDPWVEITGLNLGISYSFGK